MYFRPPKFIKRLVPQLIWHLDTPGAIHLTFDDGPHPIVTPWVLDQLDKFNAKATFFCTGKNAELQPELIEIIRSKGHKIGNHTYSHTKTLSLNCEQYIEDIDLANESLCSDLFRPPYGRLSLGQIRRISQRYRIIMWDTLSRDYSSMVTPETCANEVIPYLKEGSIIVFHDSIKASRNLYYALPKTLQAAQNMGLTCKVIDL